MWNKPKIYIMFISIFGVTIHIICISAYLALEGWTESKGVKQELFEALSLRKPITLIDEADIERLPAIPKTARKYLTSLILTEVYDNG